MDQTKTPIIPVDNNSYEKVTFVGVDLSNKTLEQIEFIECVFKNCHINDATLKKCSFDTCYFDHCSFNNAKLVDTLLRECSFNDCTLVGVDFTKLKQSLACKLSFSGCKLDFSVFSGQKLGESSFIKSNLEEVDFGEAKMEKCIFTGSDLTRAIFHHTDLFEADFRGARNYSINPKNNYLKDARFSEPEVLSLLEELGIKIEEPPEEEDVE